MGVVAVQADAVFEGGGVRALGLAGALQVAEERGYQWNRLAGTSAGAIVASLLAAGYRGEEITKMMLEEDFLKLIPTTMLSRVPLVGPALRLWFRYGLYSSRFLERWIYDLLAQRNIVTFGDLKERKLSIIASDISRGTLLVLPDDLEEYGHRVERFPIARAVRMSCSIPFFYEPSKMMHVPSAKKSYIVDGGMLSNFPVWLFDRENPRWPTFGFRLVSETAGEEHHISGPITLLRAMIYTMLEAHDNRYIKEQDKLRTILVPTLNVRAIDFHIEREQREKLVQAGMDAANHFFQNWTFAQYLAGRKNTNVAYQIRPFKSS